MFTTLIEGLMLGFSTGTICLATCTPIYLPYLLTEDRKISKSFFAVLEISAGRFVSYLAFGAMAGYLGGNISNVNRELYTSIAYLLLSLYLIMSAVRTHQKSKKCHIPKVSKMTKSAFVLGILTGINFCPSFLIALSRSVNLGGTMGGIQLFLGFFFGTTAFLLPLAFFGGLTKIRQLKPIARIASVLIGVYFIYSGSTGLYQHFNPQPVVLTEHERIIDTFAPKQPLTVIYTADNTDYFNALKDSLTVKGKKTAQAVTFINYEDLNAAQSSLDSSAIYFVDKSIFDAGTDAETLKKQDIFAVEKDYPVGKMLAFLNLHTFKVDEAFHWEFKARTEEEGHVH